jgi:putative ABC transport system permease protein
MTRFLIQRAIGKIRLMHIQTALRDLKFGARLLAKEPLINICVVLSLALGIGLNSAVFSFIDAFFLRPLPTVLDQEKLFLVYGEDRGNSDRQLVSFPDYQDLRDGNTSFSQLAGSQTIQVGLAHEGGDAEQVSGEMVTGNFFEVLGVKPALGRTFLPEEDSTPGAHPVVVLSHNLWRHRFASNSSIVGQQILLNRQPFTVIGVAAEGFKGTHLFTSPQLWVPTMMFESVFSAPELFNLRNGRILEVVGRLKTGETAEEASAELAAMAARLQEIHPEANEGHTLRIIPLLDALIPAARKAIVLKTTTILAFAMAVLLLISCANVANLLLARAISRSKEMLIRLALGARKGRLARQLLTENLLLSLLGCAAGLLVAFWVGRMFELVRPVYLTSLELALSPRVLGFTLFVSLVVGLLSGLAPVLQAYRSDLASGLRERSAAWLGHRISLSRLLIGAQAALCCVALAYAGLFLRSLQAAYSIDPGFATDQLAMVSFDVRSEGYDEHRGRALQEQLLARVRALPGVQSAELGENRLLGGFRMFRKITPKLDIVERDLQVGSSMVGPEYFSTAGIPLLEGRPFLPSDRPGTPPVVIVNKALADHLWPNRSPVGELLRLDDEALEAEVVGVTGNTKFITLGESFRMFVYLPFTQRYSPRATLHVRTAGEPEYVLESIRQEVRELDEVLPLTDVQTISTAIGQSLWLPRMGAMLFFLLGLLSLLLAAVGVYGVAAYSVNQKSFEIGVRLALGATRTNILIWSLGNGMPVLVIGVTVGWMIARLSSTWFSNLIYGTDPLGTLVLPASVMLLLSVALAANLIPVVRLVRLNPVGALRRQ